MVPADLVAQGLTYNRVMIAPDHIEAKVGELLNARVFDILSRPPPEPEANQYLSDRGLA